MFNQYSILGAGIPASQGRAKFAKTQINVAKPLNAKPSGVRSKPFKFPKGEWFDEDFDFIGPEGDIFVEMLLQAIDAVEVRDRKRKVDDLNNHRIFVRKLAANGFRAVRFFDPPFIAVMMGPQDYKGRGEPWLNGQAMGREVKLLRAAGMIETMPGVWGEVSTTFRPTNEFMIAAKKAKLTDRNLVFQLASERLLRVYSTSSDDGKLINFEKNDQSREWIAKIDGYNNFLQKQDIGIDLSRANAVQLTTKMNAQRQAGSPKLKRPDLVNKSLFRQFNNGGFEAGGRLYGAWWISCPSKLRQLITINGKRTVELDYSSYAIRMLYHKNKLPFEGDGYFLDALDTIRREKHLPKSIFRPGTKRLAQALFNTTKNGCPERVKLNLAESVKPWATEADIVTMLREKHAPIAHEFQSEAWKWLQRKDSEIALGVISNLMSIDIVALPIHDSFIVIDGEVDALRKEMNDCYFNEFGFFPEIG